MDKVPMLTTVDNPYNPFLQWDEWLAYDRQMGHYTCEYLARVADAIDGQTPEQVDKIIIDTIDEICKLNLNGLYKKVYRPAVMAQ